MYIIYKTINLINNRFYVGRHYTSADDGYLGSGKILELAIKKYGKENFIRETLEYCNAEVANEREIYWIAQLSATNKTVGGYNITIGGTGGDTLTNNPNIIEIKKKISIGNKGKKISNETKMKMSKSSKGKKLTEETKQKLRIINLNREIKPEWIEKQRLKMIGKKHTEETKQKISKSHKGKKHTEETKQKLRMILKGLKKPKWTNEHKIARKKEIMKEHQLNSKYTYIMSNNFNYWDLSVKERSMINRKFRKTNKDTIIFHNITIVRVLK